ncbi:hypothetical protein AX16_003948 [Volvariella volvacea WC 439]|nr:hypothetical protein AX16_003948 [Volvariella volvacea WC 439]
MLGESSSGLTDSDELNRRRELVIHVLREVWEEFYKWKREDSIYHLSSLNAKEPRDPPSLGVTGTTSVHPVDFSAFDSDDDEFVVETYDRDSPTPTDVKRVKPVQITVPDCIQPYPRYEFCTPLSRNISLENTRYVPFVPYYDDPSFPIREYLKHFDGLAWEKDFKNPDTDLIALEAMRRLHYGHDMTLSQIDELGILPESETLLKEAGQRDLVYWPGTLSGFPSLVPYKKDLTSTQFSIFDTILHDTQNLFCAELGCILSKCKLHPQPSHPLVPQKPLLTSDDMKTMKREPCGEDCYKNFLEEDKDGIRTSMEDIEWTNPNDVTFLKDLLKICPDDSPCDLAYICRKRCYEMFSYRCKLLPDEDILENKLSKMSLKSVKKFRKVRPVFTQKPYNTESFVPHPTITICLEFHPVIMPALAKTTQTVSAIQRKSIAKGAGKGANANTHVGELGVIVTMMNTAQALAKGVSRQRNDTKKN